MNNRTLGNSFETELCEILSSYGFWVHAMRQDNSGQPADIIAVRNKVSHLIDAKVCSDNKFPLSRVEENQVLAMDLWHECGNGCGWFALKLNKDSPDIYMISHYIMQSFKDHVHSLSEEDIIGYGTPIEKWVNKWK